MGKRAVVRGSEQRNSAKKGVQFLSPAEFGPDNASNKKARHRRETDDGRFLRERGFTSMPSRIRLSLAILA